MIAKPRDIMFYQMTTLEILQVLLDGKFPNGLVIEQKTRLDSLARIIPMVKNAYTLDPNIQKILECNKNEWISDVKEILTLCEKGEIILKENEKELEKQKLKRLINFIENGKRE